MHSLLLSMFVWLEQVAHVFLGTLCLDIFGWMFFTLKYSALPIRIAFGSIENVCLSNLKTKLVLAPEFEV